MRINFAPTLKLNFTPRVFMRDKTRVYLMVREGAAGSFFLNMEEGIIEVVKVPKEDGEYRVYKVNEGEVSDTSVKRIYHSLTPAQQDPLRVAQVMWDSTLSKSPKAERELRVFLGMSTTLAENDESQESPAKGTGASGALTLGGICEELGVEPAKARKLLRGHAEKPSGGWAWATLEEASSIKELLRSLL